MFWICVAVEWKEECFNIFLFWFSVRVFFIFASFSMLVTIFPNDLPGNSSFGCIVYTEIKTGSDYRFFNRPSTVLLVKHGATSVSNYIS